ncbi:TIR domain-containing protein [Sphingomonas sp. C8-2]|nr:TIR domain-containing protein [Sphingomonas sp. C8-2]
MAIDLDTLAQAALRQRAQVASSAAMATRAGYQTAFLCHSHQDATYVQGLLTLVSESGWHIYVDWLDPSMPSRPTADTARALRQRIDQAHFFLFLATPNALASRWCPWELGIADGRKPHERIFIIPTKRGTSYYGNEYVELYRRIDIAQGGGLATWRPGQDLGGTWLRDLKAA